jgi:hypothetical protein
MSATPQVITRYLKAADERDFPGGTADLVQAFTLRGGLIEHLAIA